MRGMLRAVLCLLGSLTLIGAAFAQGHYTQISQEEARERMEQDDSIVLDVRRPDEYAQGHIPGAICLPNETITDTMPEELPNKDQVILVYCRSGNRSKQASQKLANLGYTQVFEFGGILDWTGEVVQGEEPWETLLKIEAGENVFLARLEENASAEALTGKLEEGSVSLELHDYGGFEKVGPLPWELPSADESLTAVSGDVILCQGDQITILTGENTWSYTRLARIEGVSREELAEALGEGDVTVTLSLTEGP